MANLIYKPFSEINLFSSFFDSLRVNYTGFDDWFQRKALEGACAYAYYEDGVLKDFLYLKEENEPINLSDGTELEAKPRLKVGTFKIDNRGTTRGERFMKKILDTAISKNLSEIYVTMFDDTPAILNLKHLFEKYGFQEVGRKGSLARSEAVLVRNLKLIKNETYKDYPLVKKEGVRKYGLAIYPIYHTKLFPDSILRGEKVNLIKDVSPTNSIVKIYISWMRGISSLRPNDLILIYRTSDREGQAKYRSVITSVATIVEVKSIYDFVDENDFIKYANKYSVFDEDELRGWYNDRGRNKNINVIKMLYNIPLQKKVINKDLTDLFGLNPYYWGFFPLSDDQFDEIVKYGEIDERYFID